jgi:hypothetical protein
MEKVKCPRCGQPAFLVGPANHLHPPSFRCYSHGEYTFSADTPEARAVSDQSLAASRANAVGYRRVDDDDLDEAAMGMLRERARLTR